MVVIFHDEIRYATFLEMLDEEIIEHEDTILNNNEFISTIDRMDETYVISEILSEFSPTQYDIKDMRQPDTKQKESEEHEDYGDLHVLTIDEGMSTFSYIKKMIAIMRAADDAHHFIFKVNDKNPTLSTFANSLEEIMDRKLGVMKEDDPDDEYETVTTGKVVKGKSFINYDEED